MAVRRWQAYPDHEAQIAVAADDGTVELVYAGAVSLEALIDGYVRAAHIQMTMGGIVTCMVGRSRTALEGEAITNSALFEWKDAVKARVKPEPEFSVAVASEAERETVEAVESLEPDGLDPASLDVEDDSAIPEPVR